jgi:nitrite reductase/ring-hydroxylating ferredoxin subunit
MAKFVVGRANDIPPGTKCQATVDGRAIAIFNVDGRFYALRDVCPHRGARLSEGTVVGSLTACAAGAYDYDEARMFVKCPWHGWEFELETGQSWCEPARERVRPYRVTVESGQELIEAPADSPARVPGPYVAETLSVSVEDDYVVIES